MGIKTDITKFMMFRSAYCNDEKLMTIRPMMMTLMVYIVRGTTF